MGTGGGEQFGEWANRFFDLIDFDGDGVIGPEEYRDLMASVSINAADADAAFAKLDLNGDAPGSALWGPL